MKRVIVTGGSRGIGRAIAEKLYRSNQWEVLTTGAKSETGPTPLHVNTPIDLDYGDLGRGRFKGFLDSHGWLGKPIHALVLNAGAAIAKPFVEHTLDDFRNMFEVNTIFPWWCVKTLVTELEMGKASVIGISSISGLTGFSTMAGYCASKFGLNAVMQVGAKELSKKGIRFNNVCPGPTQTDMWNNLDKQYRKINGWESDEQSEQAYMSKLLIKRMGHVNDIADAVEFLVSDKAQYITGTNMKVCGGNLIG
ncbi:MAG: SDR family oxidoreductase [Nitrososphaerales archaeon]